MLRWMHFTICIFCQFPVHENLLQIKNMYEPGYLKSEATLEINWLKMYRADISDGSKVKQYDAHLSLPLFK